MKVNSITPDVYSTDMLTYTSTITNVQRICFNGTIATQFLHLYLIVQISFHLQWLSELVNHSGPL